jgi:molecular chaperone GrpE
MSGRRPAGAPQDWQRRAPAGSADEGRGPGHPPSDARPGPGGDPSAPANSTQHPPADAPAPAQVSGEAGEEGADVAEDLDALLADVQRERDEYLELAQRAKADFENFRKRASRDASEAEKRGKASLARELVPVVDNLERALESAEDSTPLAKGVALVLDELRAVLDRSGVEAYDPAGEKFDPAWHEALSTRADEGSESGTVIETLERGYRLDGQLLRPARVVVSE